MALRTSSTDITGSDRRREDSPAEAPDRLGPQVSFHAVGARGILFDGVTQRLYLLNRLGGFIWCCLAEGMSVDGVAAELVRRSSTDLETAQASVRSAIEKWRTLGLVGEPPESVDDAGDASAPGGRRDPLSSPRELPLDAPVRICRVLGNDFAVQFSDAALEADALPMLRAHLVDSSIGVAATLRVTRGDGGAIALSHGAETLQVLRDPRTLAPAVFASLMKLALVYSHGYPALHAAAIRAKRGAVLFPGVSGCGKSTLMTGLLAAGHEVLSDDTVVFERDTMRFRPLTPYICVKEGSWETLAPRFPAFLQRPTFRRADGAHVRYVEAPGYVARAERDPGCEVRAIVHSRYQPGSTVRLTRIAGFMALKELLPSIDPIGRRFTSDDIDRFIGWLANVECYTFVYPSLDAALDALSGVLE